MQVPAHVPIKIQFRVFILFCEKLKLCIYPLCVSACSDPSVDVSAIGIGDMFDQIEENESLKSIACQKDGRVLGMRRFADLVAEEFIDKIETVLCPGTSESKNVPAAN